MHKINVLLKLVYKTSPSYVFLLIFSSLFTSLQIFLNIILPKFLIDELIGGKRAEYLIFYTVVIVGANLLFNFINKVIERWSKLKSNYIENKLLEQMSQKVMNIKYMNLEDPYYLDLKERAVFAWQNQGALRRLINSIVLIGRNIFTIIGLAAIMLTLDGLLVGVMLLGVIIIIAVRLLFIKYQIKFMMSIIPINRKYMYYINLTTELKYAKDIKLYGMSKMIGDTFYHYNKIFLDEFDVFFKKEGFVEGLISALNGVITFIVYLYIGFKVFARQINLGSFTMYVSSATTFALTVKNIFENIMDLYQCASYLDPFVEFMELENEAEAKYSHILDKEIESIRFENVSFKYPRSDKLVLDDISFNIKKGQKISIVGLNGAGKTTLIKLLCRMYEPTSGKIYINDVNIIDYEYNSYINKISAVFQDYKLFDFSIKENITTTSDNDDKRINKIVSDVGLKEKVDSLKNGLNSNMNKNYDLDGVELSGGQTQKVAIARALYKDSSLVILDEPTSALDPMAEADIYNNFNELVKDKTAIYISHRMSSSVFCDKILIIDDGKVKDYDTHVNLMKKHDSLYYKLFNSQALNYQLD